MSEKYFLMKKEFVRAASEQITGKEKRSKINISARKFVKKLRLLNIIVLARHTSHFLKLILQANALNS